MSHQDRALPDVLVWFLRGSYRREAGALKGGVGPVGKGETYSHDHTEDTNVRG